MTPITTPTDDGQRRRLVQDFTVFCGGFSITVPAGYETDGASIPRLAWPIVGPPMRGRHFVPALVHDYLCDQAALHRSYGLRVVADAVLFHLMRQWGVERWRQVAIYAAVRLYGIWCWRRHARTGG